MDDVLKKALVEAKEALINEPNGRLLLIYRRKIWAALGLRTKEGNKAVITTPLIRRVKLAELCAKKVLPVWNEVYSAEYDAEDILELTKDYLDGMDTRRFLNKRASFKSVEDLENGIQIFIKFYNDHMAKPFKWTYEGKLLRI